MRRGLIFLQAAFSGEEDLEKNVQVSRLIKEEREFMTGPVINLEPAGSVGLKPDCAA